METLYYVCRLRMDEANVFVIWYQDKQDGFVRGPTGKLVVSPTLEQLTTAAAKLGLALVPEMAAEYDFDRLREWCRHPVAQNIDCPAFLNAWNFFDDLAGLHSNADSAYVRLSRNAEQCYDKLFQGNNLPSITPPGERYIPQFQPEELDTIRQVMETGINLLQTELTR